MAKYRKKPIVIEAEQWFPPEDERYNPAHVVGCDVGAAVIGTIVRQQWDNHDYCYSIKTLEGWHTLWTGGWIITGVKGEKYCVEPEIFEMTYERVE